MSILISCERGATLRQLTPWNCLFIEDVPRWPFAGWLRIWPHVLHITFGDPSWIEATWWKCFQHSAWRLFSKIFRFNRLPNSVFNHHATNSSFHHLCPEKIVLLFLCANAFKGVRDGGRYRRPGEFTVRCRSRRLLAGWSIREEWLWTIGWKEGKAI